MSEDAPATDASEESGAERTRRLTFWDWIRILRRTWAEASKDNLTLVSAGVAFYAILALFPGIAALPLCRCGSSLSTPGSAD